MTKLLLSITDTLKDGLKTQLARAKTILTDNGIDLDAIPPKQLPNVQKKMDDLNVEITKCYAVEMDRIAKLQKSVDDSSKDSNTKPVNILAYICL